MEQEFHCPVCGSEDLVYDGDNDFWICLDCDYTGRDREFQQIVE